MSYIPLVACLYTSSRTFMSFFKMWGGKRPSNFKLRMHKSLKQKTDNFQETSGNRMLNESHGWQNYNLATFGYLGKGPKVRKMKLSGIGLQAKACHKKIF